MSSSNQVRLAIVKESTYGNAPAAVKATRAIQEITYTAKKAGLQGNSITIQYTDTATAGAETVTVNGNAIVVGIDDGVSTAAQVRTALSASAPAMALIDHALNGSGAAAQETQTALALQTGAGEYDALRFTSEALSGSPETVESAQIRSDRQSGGQVVTGLTVGGQISFELAKDAALEKLMESAMLNDWNVMALVTRSLTIDATAKTITAVTGSFIADGLQVGDFLMLGGFTNAKNNVIVMITSVTALVLGYVANNDQVDGTGVTTTYKRFDKLTIGTEKRSLSIVKEFLDLTDKAINYKGMVANEMELNVEYGALITGSFGMNGNGYEAVDDAAELLTNDRYVTDPPTTNTLNGSVDMPFLASDVTGTFETDEFCIQSLNLQLNNNFNPQNCIGNIAPEDYTPGQASIQVSLSSYLRDQNWDMLERKLSQESFAIGFAVKNGGGAYAAYLPAVQVTFDDPGSGGGNQDVQMEMQGSAKVGPNNESALTLYRY